MDGWMVGLLVGWMDGWMEGWPAQKTNIKKTGFFTGFSEKQCRETIKGIIVYSTHRLVAQLAKTRYQDTCPQVAFAILGGTVILRHYNEIINIY